MECLINLFRRAIQIKYIKVYTLNGRYKVYLTVTLGGYKHTQVGYLARHEGGS